MKLITIYHVLATLVVTFAVSTTNSVWCVQCVEVTCPLGINKNICASQWVFCGSQETITGCLSWKQKTCVCNYAKPEDPATYGTIIESENRPTLNCDPGVDCY